MKNLWNKFTKWMNGEPADAEFDNDYYKGVFSAKNGRLHVNVLIAKHSKTGRVDIYGPKKAKSLTVPYYD